jgi:hypothetical protein
MKSLNTKLLLSALGIALLATPAFAQRPHGQAWHGSQVEQQYATGSQVTGSEANQVERDTGAYATGSDQ